MHDAPDADVRRRYTRSLTNAAHVLHLTHEGLVFDNLGAEPRPVFEVLGGRVVGLPDDSPEWAERLLESNTKRRE